MRSETKKGQSSSPALKAKAQTDGKKKPSKSSDRREERKSFWNNRQDSVLTFPWEVVYEPVM